MVTLPVARSGAMVVVVGDSVQHLHCYHCYRNRKKGKPKTTTSLLCAWPDA
jgi:hypothetical protein